MVFISSTFIDGRPSGKIIGMLKKMLKTREIDIKNCHALAYDSSSAMASDAKGTSAVIKGENQWLILSTAEIITLILRLSLHVKTRL